ncbi:hypothetical protein BKA62DRAFT_702319 [Auriculariales sp. MPI-PUGE-AT-0066]|nr:hypothetical protein BKA62DRAFT_702319 [Auriculariales sp. MPI-PUGE-AT-0066]
MSTREQGVVPATPRIRQLHGDCTSAVEEFCTWVCSAFENDPITLPASGGDISVSEYIYRSFVATTLLEGEVFVASHADSHPDAIDAIALWFPPGVDFLSSERQQAVWEDVFGKRLNADGRCFWETQYEHAVHQATTRSKLSANELTQMWHLQILAVRPSMQGRGLGKALVKDMQAKAVGQKMRLETFTEKNVKLYENWGFEVVGVSDSVVTEHGAFSVTCMSSI